MDLPVLGSDPQPQGLLFPPALVEPVHNLFITLLKLSSLHMQPWWARALLWSCQPQWRTPEGAGVGLPPRADPGGGGGDRGALSLVGGTLCAPHLRQEPHGITYLGGSACSCGHICV